eukprot:scaffold296851_cov22-Tisochrysis_lutea.AAC.1
MRNGVRSHHKSLCPAASNRCAARAQILIYLGNFTNSTEGYFGASRRTAGRMLPLGPLLLSLATSPLLALRGGQSQTVLVTGGVGYIGSHTVLELLEAGHKVVVLDSLANSNLECLERVKRLAGRPVAFCQADIRDREALAEIFQQHKPDSVIHFAGLK